MNMWSKAKPIADFLCVLFVLTLLVTKTTKDASLWWVGVVATVVLYAPTAIDLLVRRRNSRKPQIE